MGLFDALDISGNARVCQSMQNYQYNVPKVSSISVWTDEFGQDLGQYQCSKNYYSWGMKTNYGETSNPQVSLMRRAYNAFAPGAPLGDLVALVGPGVIALPGWLEEMCVPLRACVAAVTSPAAVTHSGGATFGAPTPGPAVLVARREALPSLPELACGGPLPLERIVERLRDAGEPFWLVTSDRALRSAAAPGAERVIGGGTFARELPR